jgi:hypothetical protein
MVHFSLDSNVRADENQMAIFQPLRLDGSRWRETIKVAAIGAICSIVAWVSFGSLQFP